MNNHANFTFSNAGVQFKPQPHPPVVEIILNSYINWAMDINIRKFCSKHGTLQEKATTLQLAGLRRDLGMWGDALVKVINMQPQPRQAQNVYKLPV